MFWKLNLFPSSGEGVGDTLLGSLQRSKLNHWSRAGVSHPLAKVWKEIQCLKHCVYLGFRILDDGQSPKPSNSECYTPSSEPFTIYSFSCSLFLLI
jgi:hypothetical protein